MYRESGAAVRDYFKRIPFRIHLSFDLWSSPNHRSYLGIVGHWVTAEGILHSATLGFHRFHGPHSGYNIAQTLLQVLDKLEIAGKIGYITTDNATNNNSALTELGKMLEQRNIVFNPETSRIRCFGDIINLVVKGFLWGSDWEAFETNTAYNTDIAKEGALLQAWRKKGPMGKLHNIGIWILRTPQRRDRFAQNVRLARGREYTGPLIPLVGNVTRRSSDADALERAFELRDILEGFIGTAITEERSAKARRLPQTLSTELDIVDHDLTDPDLITSDELTRDDWDDLATILQILKPFRRLTLQLQGTGTKTDHANGYLARVLPAMDDLLAHLEDAKHTYSDTTVHSTHLLTSINHAWGILDKYVLL